MTPKCPDCKRDQDDCICASPASAPEGFVLVPVEPTEEMLNAMFETRKIAPDDADLIVQYNALLAAAPTPPAEDRKDAERYHKLVKYLIGDRTDLDDAIVAAASKDEMSAILDAMQEDKP